MVQTYQSPVRIYKYPFEFVMAAYEKRFPTCPQIPIFVGCELTYEYHSPDGAEEVLERKCQLNVDAPYLLKKIAGVDYVYFNQKNSLDRRKRTLTIEASNVSFSSRIVIKENCFYYVHPDNPQWTCFEQSASLDVKSFFGFESTVEKLAVKQYAANLTKGKEILEFFFDQLIKDGVTYLPPFQEKTPPSSPADSAIDVSKPDETASHEQDDFDVDRPRHSSHDDRRNTVISVAGGRRKSQQIPHQSSLEDADSKLEAEYIRRFLGQLTPLEESRLCELKYWLQDHHKGKLPNDAHLLRFLRARDFDVVKAREMVQNSLMWRKQHNVDRILQTFQPPSVLQQFFPGCWHHQDREGRPVFVLRLGQLDIKGLLRSVGLETLVKFTLSICEQGLIKTAEATKQLGAPISTWTMLVDLEGLSMRHLWRPGVQALLRIIEIVQAHYPETMGLVLIARAPRVFPVLWTLISPFIDENTRKKFMINSGDPVLVELAKYIDDKYLPEFLGGNCFCLAPEGGHVPKSMYLPVPEDHGHSVREDDVLQSIYTLAHVYKGMPHEVLVPVASKGCVLTWDFDVIKGHCEFQLLRCPRILNPDTAHSPAQSPSATLGPVEMVTAAISGTSATSQTPVAFDKTLQLGADLTIEEKPVCFTEGDSMQGSHYCSQTGTYILQWRQQADTVGAQTTFDFTLPGQKCKLMYYHELLDSVDFKGSMASLESCRSSFSSLAAASSQPSTSGTPSSVKKNTAV